MSQISQAKQTMYCINNLSVAYTWSPQVYASSGDATSSFYHTCVSHVYTMSSIIIASIASSFSLRVMSVPSRFPSLPPPSGQWSPNVRAVHTALCDIYNHAIQLLNQEDNDPIRIAFHTDALSSDSLILLKALESEGADNPD